MYNSLEDRFTLVSRVGSLWLIPLVTKLSLTSRGMNSVIVVSACFILQLRDELVTVVRVLNLFCKEVSKNML